MGWVETVKAGAPRWPNRLLCRCRPPAQHWARPRALFPSDVRGLPLSWAFLTRETVQSYEFLKHSICLVS